MVRDPHTPFTSGPLQPAPAQYTARPAKKSRGPWIALVTLLVLALVGAGGYFAYGYFFKNSGEETSNTQSQSPTTGEHGGGDHFVSFPVRVTYLDPDDIDTSIDHSLVGFKQNGEEIEIYPIPSDAWALKYAITGPRILLQDCSVGTHIFAIDYASGAGDYTPAPLVDLKTCLEFDFVAIKDNIYYTKGGPESREIFKFDLKSGSETLVANLHTLLGPTVFGDGPEAEPAYMYSLHATGNQLIFRIQSDHSGGDWTYSFDVEQQKLTKICSNCHPDTALNGAVLFSIYGPNDDEWYSCVGFTHYDIYTENMTVLAGSSDGQNTGFHCGSEPVPVQNGYVYTSTTGDDYENLGVYYVELGQQPRLLANLRSDNYRTLTPISDGEVLLIPVFGYAHTPLLFRHSVVSLAGEILKEEVDTPIRYGGAVYPQFGY
ncbi:MAG: hypothetical protein FWG15_02445 [Propionibacteriaceae bacterium]|nr:hypothetical protein [Propionibacteriaceae bacterium]